MAREDGMLSISMSLSGGKKPKEELADSLQGGEKICVTADLSACNPAGKKCSVFCHFSISSLFKSWERRVLFST